MKIKRGSKPGAVIVEFSRRDEQFLSGGSPLRLQHILVATDFSHSSKRALHYAAAMAGQFGARLTLLHVTDILAMPAELGRAPDDSGLVTAGPAQEELEELAQLTLPELCRRNAVRATVRTGLPCREITIAAETSDVDLIILSTHGYTGVSGVFLGSTTERVVNRAPCPVLVVREGERDLVPTNTQSSERRAQ